MAGLKRAIYGLPLLAPYRAWRTRRLAAQMRDHPLGFRFAGRDAFFAEEWEPHERVTIAGELDRADRFVDIGANQGIYTCLAASKGVPTAAVEPEAGNLRFLLANIAANDFAVEVFPVALGAAPGIATLFGDGDTASLVRGWSGASAAFAQRVPVNSLDHLFADRWPGERLFIKMDVEGFESAVLSGAARLVSRPRTTWFIETAPIRYDAAQTPNPGFAQVFAALFGAGYRAIGVEGGRAVTAEDVRRAIASPLDTGLSGSNFLFRRPDEVPAG